MAKLRITWVKSSIGYAKDQKVTVRTLGLRRLNQTVVQDDNPAIRGMVHKVRHLVRVEPVAESSDATESAATVAPAATATPEEAVEPMPGESVDESFGETLSRASGEPATAEPGTAEPATAEAESD